MIHHLKYYMLFTCFTLVTYSCGLPSKHVTLFETYHSDQTFVDFSNDLSEGDSLNILNYVYYYNGGGVGIADVNNDGFEDLFFTGNEVSCRLYLNKGNFQFEDATEVAGLTTDIWATGVSMVDINSDGWVDIYVCAAGNPDSEERKNLLFLNQGSVNNQKVHFEEVAESFGIADASHSTHAAFFDYDMDNDLDLYVMNHDNERSSVNTPLPKDLSGEGSSCDHLYKNNGNNSFTDVSKQAGIIHEGYGLGLAVSDINLDGLPDIYVSNDFIYNDLLYINNGNGTFDNKINSYLKHQSYNGMGCEIADVNNDGFNDIVVLDMMPQTKQRQKMMAGGLTFNKQQLILQMGYEPQYMRNTLQMNNGNQSFSEIGRLSGIYKTDWSWSVLMADFDVDGWKDLFISNGYLRDITDHDFIDYNTNLVRFESKSNADKVMLSEIRKAKGIKTVNAVFRNNKDLTFTQNNTDWGISLPSFSNGAAYADLDNDGDLDLVINNINEEATILRNQSKDKTYITILLQGVRENPTGIGSKVTVYTSGLIQVQEQYPFRGFQSTATDKIFFGLGDSDKIDSIHIQWPDGNIQVLKNVLSNQTVIFDYRNSIQSKSKNTKPSKKMEHPIFVDVSNEFDLDFIHKENPFNDFNFQGLLPHRFSQSGPKISQGDLDGDGLIDFYVGGSKGESGKIFYQDNEGKFEPENLGYHLNSEDMDALIFDANGDGMNDLYVVSGGSEFPKFDQAYKDRLYINNGNRQFQYIESAIPNSRTSGSCVKGADFDNDDDIDLFVGGRLIPTQYPFAAESYLLQNDNGVFTDVADSLAPGLKRLGLVTDAIWSDYNNDSQMDLIVVGEWMPVSVFRNNNTNFENATDKLGLSTSSGWWNVIEKTDVDNDGDEDFIVGNLGLNSKFAASEKEPVSIAASDFDNNGSIDAFISYFVNGEETPEPGRNETLNQIVSLEKKFSRYAPYANAKINDFFPKEKLSKAYHLKAYQFQSSIIINSDEDNWKVESLPMQAQVSPVYGIVCHDFNGDGFSDILLGGNFYGANISTGPNDAMIGLFLKGNKNGEFTPVSVMESGFFIEGEVKDMTLIKLQSGNELIVVTNNQGPIQIFKRNNT